MKTILFACVHNAGRSQMAEALFNNLANPQKAKAISAGTHPAHQIHPNIIKAMSEMGIDISKAKPKKLTKEMLEGVDLFITMGCDEDCPYSPHLERKEWQISNSYENSLEETRRIRQELELFIQGLIKERKFQ